MTGVTQRFTEEDKAAITERLRELARFADGDHVTVEPTDHDIAYAGNELERALLTVDDVYWNSNNLAYPSGQQQPEHSRYSDEHYVELRGDYEHYRFDTVLVTGIEYRFKETNFTMPESSLMAWDEYRAENERIKLLGETPSDNETHWLEPFEDGDCEVCGCNMAKHWYFSNGVQNAGGHECAACGDIKERHGP